MNYFPYFRGKQYELICIRENADLISSEGFVPIIEPVREQANALARALEALRKADAPFLVVANPSVGPHTESLSHDVREAVDACISEHDKGGWLYQVKAPQDVVALKAWVAADKAPALLHAGYTNGKEVRALIDDAGARTAINVFTSNCPESYTKEFPEGRRVMIADGFTRQRNADYPDEEFFSDLNVTHAQKGFDGFGDYLIVGPEFNDGGGPAYAVAIHITYMDPDNNNGVYVRHFISDERKTQTDPAGKFKEALAYLAADCSSRSTKIRRTPAIEEFLKLYSSGHFPGLGYVKKLSMQHHLELLAG